MGTILSRRTMIVFTGAFACFMALALTQSAVHAGSGDRIRYKFLLHPPAKLDGPKGKAKYEERTSGRKKLKVEVEHIGDATSTIDVFVDGQSVGAAALSACSTEIELDTENGDTVPTMTQSSVVEVFDADTDVKLLTSV